MKRGPRPIPTHLRVLQGNPGHRPLNRDEPQPLIPDECPDPPEFLTGYAADEWWRVGAELHRLGLLTIVDIAPLAAYCNAYERWRTAEESLKKIADNDPVMHGLMIKRDANAVVNHLVGIARKAAGDMVRYASEFGLTPAARARIAAGVGEQQQHKFAGLLAG
jgi:P27 family predicted phage terminase small subunit